MQVVKAQGSCPSAFHLLKIIEAFDIPHKEQAFQRLNIRACCNHVHSNRYSWIVFVAKSRQYRFWVFFGFVRYFLAKGIAFSKLFPHNIDNIISMAVVFGKNKSLGNFLSSGKDFRQLLLKCPYHAPYLAGIDNFPVKLPGSIGQIFVQLFPAFFAGKLLTSVHKLPGRYVCSVPANVSLNYIHIIAHIHAVCYCFFMAVLAHHIFIEKAKGAFIRCGCQTY